MFQVPPSGVPSASLPPGNAMKSPFMAALLLIHVVRKAAG
jgi:hypothetical protein